MFRLQKDNFQLLSVEGGLEVIRNDLPKTINDTFDLVRAMNERYLWIDCLCLIQDDVVDVSLGIEQMNSIYQGSYFTIVAASGDDANVGLPRVGSNSNICHQTIKDIGPCLRMTVLHSIDWHLRRSVYNKRGWTLQELTLSRRTVIFINDRIYFRCQDANWSEDTWADKWINWLDADDSNISRIPDPNDGLLHSFWAYQKLCEDYSRRKLRNDGDALRAFAGISRPLASSMETNMIEGLPGFYLDQFLLFISSNGTLRRRPEFASFSWAGWQGSVMWPRENYVWYDESSGEQTWKTSNIGNWFKHKRIIKWHVLDSSYIESPTFQPMDIPSPLFELIRQYPRVFSTMDVDPEQQRSLFALYYDSRGSYFDVPDWEQNRYLFGEKDEDDEDEDDSDFKHKSRLPFPMKQLNLANGQAEFNKIVRYHDLQPTKQQLHLANGKAEFDLISHYHELQKRSLRNWMAQREFRKSM
jgi:Heterokaryon incompatibility protein (HET)